MGELVSIQYMRAIAALAVVFYHVGSLMPRVDATFAVGDAGVDVFFVVSGFIMWTTASAMEPLRFMARRVARIVPLYWLMTVLVAVVTIQPEFAIRLSSGVPELLNSLFFLPHVDPAEGIVRRPLLQPGWTLNYEMMFYLVMAGALVLSRPARLPAIALVLGGLAVLGQVAPPGSARLDYYTNPIILEFLYGIGLSVLWKAGVFARVAPVASCIALVLAALLMHEMFRGMHRAVGYGVPAVAFVAAGLCAEPVLSRHRLRVLHLVGDASYSIYLTHTMALAVFGAVANALGIDDSGVLGKVFWAALCALVGIIVWQAVERPLTAAARNLLLAERRARSSAG